MSEWKARNILAAAWCLVDQKQFITWEWYFFLRDLIYSNHCQKPFLCHLSNPSRKHFKHRFGEQPYCQYFPLWLWLPSLFSTRITWPPHSPTTPIFASSTVTVTRVKSSMGVHSGEHRLWKVFTGLQGHIISFRVPDRLTKWKLDVSQKFLKKFQWNIASKLKLDTPQMFLTNPQWNIP